MDYSLVYLIHATVFQRFNHGLLCRRQYQIQMEMAKCDGRVWKQQYMQMMELEKECGEWQCKEFFKHPPQQSPNRLALNIGMWTTCGR